MGVDAAQGGRQGGRDGGREGGCIRNRVVRSYVEFYRKLSRLQQSPSWPRFEATEDLFSSLYLFLGIPLSIQYH